MQSTAKTETWAPWGDPTAPTHLWSKLGNESRDILESIRTGWAKLILDRHHEEVYHSYLNEHAGFFLNYPWEVCVVISKLRLGAEHTTDFIVGRDGSSAGMHYELIELETPYDAPFTNRGNPSARLTAAIQQIQNWRSWIRENRQATRKLLPAIGVRTSRAAANYTFKVIIGNRENSERWLDRRNDLARQLGIEIRSFEYLTDFVSRDHYSDTSNLWSAEESSLTSFQRNMLANPFFEAYSDSEWRRLVSEPRYTHHFIANNAEVLLEYRRYNQHQEAFLSST
jgi:hypothetical protein